MHFRLIVRAKFEGTYGFNDVHHRVGEILEEAQRKLAALGHETDVIIRNDDGSTPSPAEAEIDTEEQRRERWKVIKAALSELNNPNNPDNVRERERVQAKLRRLLPRD